MCNCIHELLNAFEDSAQREHTIGEHARVVYITYTMATQDLLDIYALVLGPADLGLGHIYQANPLWPWYNY